MVDALRSSGERKFTLVANVANESQNADEMSTLLGLGKTDDAVMNTPGEPRPYS